MIYSNLRKNENKTLKFINNKRALSVAVLQMFPPVSTTKINWYYIFQSESENL